jgi:hypothetical protein
VEKIKEIQKSLEEDSETEEHRTFAELAEDFDDLMIKINREGERLRKMKEEQ